MVKKKNFQCLSPSNMPILIDVFYRETGSLKPVLIFSHGFKGFKDWGPFDLVADFFAEKGFCFIKFNFSFNGTTPDQPTEFADPDAFAENNFSKELEDLGTVIDWVKQTEYLPNEEADKNQIYLLGHSRGGSVTIIRTYEDERVKKGISWSAPIDLKRWDDETLKNWEKNGVIYVENARTGQELPMHYQLVQDLEVNSERLNVRKAIENMPKPFMVAHGTEDEAVSYQDALEMKKLNEEIKLELIPNAGHTYGGSHPYNFNYLPRDLKYLLNACSEFLLKAN